MGSTVHAIVLVITLFLSFGVLLVWGIRPLLSHRESGEYRQFILTDMYVLVLQIALIGMLLRRSISEDDRFLTILVLSAITLAFLWRFIVAALDDNAIVGGWRRVAVLVVAPIQILVGPVIPLIGLMWMSEDSRFKQAQGFAWACIAAGLLIPVVSRLTYTWARRRS